MENPRAIAPFLRSFLAAKKSLLLYPPGSEMAASRLQLLRRALDDVSAPNLVFPIRVGRDRFSWAGGELVSTDPAMEGLRLDLQAHGIAEFSIDAGVEEWEIREFLEFLNQPSEKILTVGDAPAYLRERGVVHVRVAAPGGLGLPAEAGQLSTAHGVEVADDTGGTTLLGARPGRHPVDLLVDAILDMVDERLTGLTYDCAGLLQWFQAVAAEGRLEKLCAAAKMLVTMAEGYGDREVRVRTTLEALLLLPEATLKPLLTEWLMPLAATDLAIFNLLTQVTEDELAEIARHIPPEQLMTLASDLLEFPWEKGKRQRLVQAITDTLKEGGGPAAPGLLLERDDPLMVELRQEIIDACHPDILLERSADLLLALVLTEGSDEHPGFSIEALEDIIGEALARSNLALAVRVLQSLGAGEAPSGDLARERAERLARLRRKAADRPQVTQVVGLLRQGSAPQQLDAIAGYLRLVADDGVKEFAALLAEEADRRTRVLMCEVLARVGPAVIPVLLPLLADQRWFVARNVLYILGKVRHSSALTSILAALDHPHPRVRVEAIRAVSLIDGAGAAPHLSRCLGDSDPMVRRAVIAAVSAPGYDAAVAPLRDVLLADAKGRDDVDVKLEAIRALVTIGTPLAHDTLGMIADQPVRFWQRTDRQVREAAAAALAAQKAKHGG
ncbi:MAG TPA: HEAT repeat domain-containing protein [Methylomirabilota bacterium]|nr:HEAT repeat domain-containing protein [Methylomirabilota bacterium]